MMSNFANHEKDGGCARRVVPCEACGDYCFADELRRHEVTNIRGGDCRRGRSGKVERVEYDFKNVFFSQTATILAFFGVQNLQGQQPYVALKNVRQ